MTNSFVEGFSVFWMLKSYLNCKVSAVFIYFNSVRVFVCAMYMSVSMSILSSLYIY